MRFKAFSPTRRRISEKYGNGAGEICALACALKQGWPDSVPESIKNKTGLDDEALVRAGEALYELFNRFPDGVNANDKRAYIAQALGFELAERGRPKGKSEIKSGLTHAIEIESLIKDKGLKVGQALDKAATDFDVSIDILKRQRRRYRREVRDRRLVDWALLINEKYANFHYFVIESLIKTLQTSATPIEASIEQFDGEDIKFDLCMNDEVTAVLADPFYELPRNRDSSLLSRIFRACCTDHIARSDHWGFVDRAQMFAIASSLLLENSGIDLGVPQKPD